MVKIKSGRRLIFVGGAPRSGTTLVQNMLDCHPLILGGVEFLHLPNLIEFRKSLHSSISKGWIDIICSKDDVDNHLSSFIEKLFLPLADKDGCEFYSEKTPMNILVFPGLIELFPESHFIQVIRDPRAIVSSMQQVKKRSIAKGVKIPYFTENLTASITYAKQCFATGFHAEKNFPGRVLTVVYEKLLADPEKETKRICDFLGIEWSNLMLYPGEKEHIGQKAITVQSDEIWYDAKSYNRNLDSKSIEKWQSELSLGQQVRTLMAFQDDKDLVSHGYNFSLDSLTQVSNIWARGYYFYLCVVNKVYSFFSFIVRKIPGRFRVKKILLSLAGLIE